MNSGKRMQMKTEGKTLNEHTKLTEFLEGPPLVSPVRSAWPVENGALGGLTSGQFTIWLTGTGAPSVRSGRAGPSTTLQIDNAVILVDVGNGTGYQLSRLGIDLAELTHIFITHHHIDHNADLGFLLASPWIGRGRENGYRPPTILGPPGTFEHVRRVLAACDYDIRVRIPHGYLTTGMAPTVYEMTNGSTYHGEGWRATAFGVEHMPVDQALGFRFDTDGGSLVISGDTRPCENLLKYASNVDCLVHEAIWPGFGFPDYHTLSTDVGKVAEQAKARQLVLTHLLPGNVEDAGWLEHAVAEYNGPVTVGRDLLRVVVRR